MTIPLPEPDTRLPMDGPPRYRADQMLAYAAACVAEERERCAAIMLANAEACTGLTREILLANVVAIRKGE